MVETLQNENRRLGALLRLELRKAFRNPFFYGAVLLSLGLALAAAALEIQEHQFWREVMERMGAAEWDRQKNPMVGAYILYNSWMGGEVGTWAANLYYYLVPILAVMPYGWSLLEEKRSGAGKQLLVRGGRKSYYVSKYIAAFLSGGTVVAAAQTVNFLTVACVIPAPVPDASFMMYHAVSDYSLWAEWFYSKPAVYVLLYLLLNFCFAGLWAGVPLALSFFFKNRLTILFGPFLFLLLLQFLCDLAFAWRVYLEVSPFAFLRGRMISNPSNGYVILAELLLIFLFGFGITMARGRREDVF